MNGLNNAHAALSLAEKKELARKLLLQRATANAAIRDLSYGQQAMWFLYLKEPLSPAYNEAVLINVVQPLDLLRFEKAFQQLLVNNPLLRTVYHNENGVPVKTQTSDVTVNISVTNTSGWAADEQAAAFNKVYNAPFDLSAGPLHRVGVFQSAETCNILVVMHHIVCDGWSMQLLFKQLIQNYTALREEATPSLQPPAFSMYDVFIREEQVYMASQQVAEDLLFWKKQLAGELPQGNLLPVMNKTPDRTATAFNTIRIPVEKMLWLQLENTAAVQQVTVFTSLLAVFQILIYQYSNQASIMIGTPSFNRESAQYKDTVGYFVNTLPVQVLIDPALSFSAHTKKLQQQLLELLKHSRYPFSEMTAAIVHKKGQRQDNLLQFYFTMDKRFTEDDLSANTSISLEHTGFYQLQKAAQPFNFHLAVIQHKDNVELLFQYDAATYSDGLVTQMGDQFLHLLQQVNDVPEQAIRAMDTLTAAESALLEKCSAGKKSSLPVNLFVSAFLKQVMQHASRIAVADHSGSFSYQQLNDWSDQLASNLIQLRGITKTSVIGVYLERSIYLPATIIGIWKTGAIYLPLDPYLPVERLQYMIDNAGVDVIVCSKAFSMVSNNVQLLHTDDISLDNKTIPSPIQMDWPLSAADGAYLIYTSGSTGKPKGVVIEQAGMMNHLYSKVEDLQLTQESIVAQTASQNFDISIWQMFAVLLAGGQVRIYNYHEILQSSALARKLEQDRVTVIQMVPSFLAVMLDSLETSLSGQSFNYLHYLVTAGEELTHRLAARWFARMPGTRLLNGYGPSEAADNITVCVMNQLPAGNRIPIGTPVNNLTVYVVNQHGKKTPVGVTGEIWVSGIALGKGYIGLPKLTEAVFAENPFDTSTRIYRTGDLGFWSPEGILHYAGRLDNQIKLHGHRIEPGEIERVILSYKNIRQALVVYRPDLKAGNLVAYIVWQHIEQEDIAGLRQHLQKWLPVFMIPAQFQTMDILPLTVNGKIDRKLLPVPDQPAKIYTAPVNDTQLKLCHIWQNVLGISTVGVHDDFFAIGGYSLMMMQVINKIKIEFEIEIAVKTLFELSDIESLGQYIDVHRMNCEDPAALYEEVFL